MTNSPTKLRGPRVGRVQRQLVYVKIPHDHDITAERPAPENKSEIVQAVVESFPVPPVEAHDKEV